MELMNLDIYYMEETKDCQTKKMSPKEVKIVSSLDGLDLEGLGEMPGFVFKETEQVKNKEGEIQVLRPEKKNLRVKELF